VHAHVELERLEPEVGEAFESGREVVAERALADEPSALVPGQRRDEW